MSGVPYLNPFFSWLCLGRSEFGQAIWQMDGCSIGGLVWHSYVIPLIITVSCSRIPIAVTVDTASFSHWWGRTMTEYFYTCEWAYYLAIRQCWESLKIFKSFLLLWKEKSSYEICIPKVPRSLWASAQYVHLGLHVPLPAPGLQHRPWRLWSSSGCFFCVYVPAPALSEKVIGEKSFRCIQIYHRCVWCLQAKIIC